MTGARLVACLGALLLVGRKSSSATSLVSIFANVVLYAAVAAGLDFAKTRLT